MTQDEIIRMAREVWNEDVSTMDLEALERFASLVAAHEREACAKVCDGISQGSTRYDCAAAIRARGEK